MLRTEKRYSLLNTKRSLEKEINELMVQIMEEDIAEELYNSLCDKLDELEDDLNQVNYEMGEY